MLLESSKYTTSLEILFLVSMEILGLKSFCSEKLTRAKNSHMKLHQRIVLNYGSYVPDEMEMDE